MDFNSLKLNFVSANSGDPDEMLHYATFNLFLHSQSTHLGFFLPSRVAQLVTCLATDGSLTEDPGLASSIPARSHTFV